MMNNYVKSILNRKNEFRIQSVFTLFDTKIAVNNLKIDTGCGFTIFPLKTLGMFTTLEAQMFKLKDIRNNVKYSLSYGVETGGERHIIPQTEQDKMCCRALGFFKEIYDFSIGGVKIRDRSIRVNYNRSGNLLLGMDILKDWDIHIRTIDTGETIFLGCPKEQVNDAYLQELEDTFHIASELNAKNIR